MTPDLLAVLMVSPERMSLLSLLSYTEHLSENRQKSERYQIALWKKLVYPLAAFVMVALALPFGYSHNRVGGVSLKILPASCSASCFMRSTDCLPIWA